MRRLVLVPTAALALFLTACSDNDTPSTPGNIGNPVVASNDDSNYLASVKQSLSTEGYDVTDITDSDLLDVGKDFCTLLDSGETFNSMGKAYLGGGIDPEFAGVIMGSAIGALCPEHKGQIPGN